MQDATPARALSIDQPMANAQALCSSAARETLRMSLDDGSPGAELN